ncbi:hypothetical protein [Nocardia pseudobrasiliensis]|uniref:Uncharacterized protein n=1 Tax=Nocardia pseudobrasiliensis TaxID=45979 RepID=A0A370I1S4_9NOCA|nr:hypothetical protein [Nocardia pseudobrasiliensis]RDI64530.1 hypothetical protein DFR76_108363 [Nocardia pseudobrasiliensis]
MGQATEPLSQAQARSLDLAGEWYTVVYGEPAAPAAILQVVRGNRHIDVTFPDDHGRPVLTFDFRQIDDDRMFLTTVTRWEYGADSARSMSDADVVDKLSYREDGTVHRDLRDQRTHERTTTDFAEVDVNGNWEPVPVFGDWASIARRDR